MSKMAGILLIVIGGGALALGIKELIRPDQLPPLSIYSTTGIGLALLLIGLLHFRAPHKSFLISIPLLMYFHAQMYFNSLFYFNRPLWTYQGVMAGISIIVLALSYFGYLQSKKAAKASLQT